MTKTLDELKKELEDAEHRLFCIDMKDFRDGADEKAIRWLNKRIDEIETEIGKLETKTA